LRTGKIISIDTANGTGWITDENDQEISFHIKTMDIRLNTSDDVEFEIELTHNGLEAVRVKATS
jgi:cold shock CspA family protein